ncbi:MAG: YebC/PmpR family DNA-binding transcriptional regulator [Clostridia bacterium]|nr:YebC/PmpR family DNA-binding transcriptional regulator [Clostridia bacterium]
MSGHSKWANIKHRKEQSDAKRGKIFTKIGREIYVAVRSGGPDPEANSKLKDVIAKAKASNMPNDNIARSIKKASGAAAGENYDEIVYEGYGPAGAAVIVETMTDNKNRTAADVRHIFDKYGGNMGTTGCVSYMFDRKGIIIIEKSKEIDEDGLMLKALEAGADDVAVEEEYFEVSTSVGDFSKVREELEKEGYVFVEAQLRMVPQTMIELDEKQKASMEKLIDMLEDNDDVQNIYHNWDI